MLNLVEKDSHDYLAAFLAKNGVNGIEVSLSGGGDEGGIDDITFCSPKGHAIDGPSIEEKMKSFVVNMGTSYNRNLHDYLEDIIYENADASGDYCNNEGGSVIINYIVTEEGLICLCVEFTPGTYEDECDDPDDEFLFEIRDESPQV